MAKKKVQHGGPRRGAGRPPKEGVKAVVITASVPGDVVAQLAAFTEAKGWTRSKAVTEALRRLLKRGVSA